MIDSPIQIRNPVFTRVQVIALPTHQPGNAPASHEASVDSTLNVNSKSEDESTFVAQLRVKFNVKADPHFPYSIDVACMCRIAIDASVARSERPEKAALAGHEMMFPAIRELVLSLTARQPWGPFSIGVAVMEMPSEADPGRDRSADIKPKRMRRKRAEKAT